MRKPKLSSSIASLRLGRISKKVEEKMGIALASDVSIYLLEVTLNAYACEYPESYLTLVEEIANVIRKPDAFYFEQEKEELHYFRLYSQGNALFLLEAIVSHRGMPRKWILSRFCAHRDLREASPKENLAFERI